ncbi:hypothetical protein HA402_009157 [Bradysia odoriphaga]|nr:hypothetical protein HA402_009157 [Bradysia odoriphaga]
MSSSMFLVNRQAFDRRREVLDKKISKWQIKEKGFLQSFIEATEFCCLNTSLHGLRNIYESVVEYNRSKSSSANGVPSHEIDFFLKNLSKLVAPEYTNDLFESTHKILEELGYRTDTLMKEVMHPCDNMLTQCLWLGQFLPCNTLFRTAKSIDGYCCSFNYDAIREDLEIDSNNVSEKLQNPNYRVSGAGPYVGMELLVNIEPEQYVSYTKTYFGVSVLIHSPHEYPQNSVAKTVGQIGTDVIINVVPSVIVSENSIKDLALAQRNCYFTDEVVKY